MANGGGQGGGAGLLGKNKGLLLFSIARTLVHLNFCLFCNYAAHILTFSV